MSGTRNHKDTANTLVNHAARQSNTHSDGIMNPLVSIVTVSLNAATTIDDTLASVSRQEVQFAVEHICVDGGSSDATRDIIDRWATCNPLIVRIYESDGGIFEAMNKGLRAAEGEYVLFLNADDFLVSPNTLACAMSGCIGGADGNPDLIVGDAVMGKPGTIGFWRRRRVPRLLGRIKGLGLFPVHQGQFSKRRLLKAVGGFDERLRLAADINQYYDLERLFRPSTRLLWTDVVFMQAGGAANAGLNAIYRGTLEVYRHLSAEVGSGKAAIMVFVKTLQSLSEIRYGRCPQRRWFANGS